MARTLIVPDVHEQYHKLLNIEEVYMPQADRVVMLGDFWDTFSPEKAGHEMAMWLIGHLDDPKFTVLMGNHDASYAFKGPWRCSGYSPWTQAEIDKVLTREDWRKFKGYTRVGKFLVSHAGFHPRTIDLAEPDIAQAAIESALDGEWSRWWDVGYCRGGRKPIGGPSWLDWNEEFEPMEQAQLVGHTYDRGGEVRAKTYRKGEIESTSYCLDSGLRHVMWVDEATDEVEIVKL